MKDKMTPGGEEHKKFMASVIPGIQNLRDRVLAKYQGNDKGIADGWFIATLISLAITIGKRGGLNGTQLRAVFEMYLETIDIHPEMQNHPLDPKTIISKDG